MAIRHCANCIGTLSFFRLLRRATDTVRLGSALSANNLIYASSLIGNNRPKCAACSSQLRLCDHLLAGAGALGRLQEIYPPPTGDLKEGKGSPYLIAERRVSELIPILGSQSAGDVSHKPGGRLPLLSERPAVTLATLKRAATNFAGW